MEATVLADSIRSIVLSILNSKTTEIPDSWLSAQWVSEEVSDTSLSIIRMPDGSTCRGVPKSSSVGALAVNDTVLVAVPRASPMVIVCRVVGSPGSFTV